jgi:23S rRNA U2552 (ribose-2'-O)-methylase RlmE/FtsJ
MDYNFIKEEEINFNLVDPKLINIYKYNQLFHYKNSIKYIKNWVKSRNKFDKLVKIYRPPNELINRAYYKCWEIINKYNITVNSPEKMEICNLCEAPGGFIQAIYDHRMRYHEISDNFIGISLLNSDDKNFRWANQFKYFAKINFKIYRDSSINNKSINDENNNNNNILNPIVIETFIKSFGEKKCDLVTGDGGLYVKDELQNYKEIYHSNLFFSEIFIALNVLKEGGNFILKIYDITTQITLDFLQLLFEHFESVNIFKPETSRIFNSERYVICTYFKGIDKRKLDYLFCIIEESWYNKSKILFNIYENGYKYDEKIINIISKTNSYILNKQLQNYKIVTKV